MGLHEQYFDDLTGNTVCTNLDTVMNAANRDLENCRGVHAPTAWDIDAVDTYWDAQAPSNPTLLSNSGVLTLTWEDTSWSDTWQRTVLYYWDRSTSSWKHQETNLYNDGIGFHNNGLPAKEKRTMRRIRDVRDKGWPTGTWYIARADSWSWPYNNWEQGSYSDYVYVD